MVVIVQSKNAVIDSCQIIKVTTNKDGGVFAVCNGNYRETLGEYESLKGAKFVLEMYAEAMATGDKIFEFPTIEEVRAKLQITHNSSNRYFSANSHGGS